MNYENALKDILLADERYVVMTAENRAAIRNLPSALGDRFIDTGIAEQTMVGAAAGLALRGRVPVVHALAAFLTMRAFEFIRTDVGIPCLPVKLVGGVPGFLSTANGPTHQALEDVSLMRGIPNVHVFCPADEQDLVIGLRKVLESPNPFYIRHNPLPAVVEHDPDFKIGKAKVVSDGTDVSILVYGMLFRQAYEARNLLEAEGISVRLINLRTIKPIDERAILRAAWETGLVVTLEDHFLTGGLFSIVSELLLHHRMAANVLPIALPDRWFRPALLDNVLEREGFTGPQIAERISGELQKRKPFERRVPVNIKKRPLKSKPLCKVTFRLPQPATEDAREVHLVGDFNGWDTCATPMRRLKSGDFTVTLDLPVGKAYQFRYLIDQATWENDEAADEYVPSPYPSVENSVVVV